MLRWRTAICLSFQNGTDNRVRLTSLLDISSHPPLFRQRADSPLSAAPPYTDLSSDAALAHSSVAYPLKPRSRSVRDTVTGGEWGAKRQ
jgi:hypothetical protein